MAIRCPYCQHGMSIKEAKPGRYKPKCSKCGQRFALTIYPQADRAPLAEPLPSETAAAAATVPAPDAPAPAPPKKPAPVVEASANATLPSQRTSVAAPDATLAFDATRAPTAVPVNSSQTASSALTRMSVPQRGSTDATAIGPISSPTQPAVDATIATVPLGTGQSASGAMPATGQSAGVPERIGGYKIVKELGRGAMGAVYLARQLSLDRDVALKTIQAQWANHPSFIARFTREAYAAAQLTHHNVVQIYDLGVDGGSNYFSMEFVRGESLDDIVHRSGPLPPDVAVGYTLQAARGLHYAHTHGMVHRDVKPANMLLNDQGVVKIADLGLVKVATAGANGDEEPPPSSEASSTSGSLMTARADVTTVNVAMGTPAFMAPEQADNAAGVDHRADIYSLGCSLYVMLTGKPLFQGATAIEVLTKHRTAQVVRPDMVVSNVPKSLADITLKMVAKQPEQRYQNLAEVIRELEQFLAGSTGATFAPTEEQANLVSQESKRFQQPALTKVRGLISGGFIGLSVILSLATLFISWSFAGALLALAFSAVVSYFVIAGVRDHSPIFDRARSVLYSAPWSDWMMWGGGASVFVLALWLVGWLWVWIAASVVGAGLGVAYWAVVDRRLAVQRQSVIESIQGLLRGWRLKGLDETSLRLFVAQHSGEDWEELYEALFGFDAKLEARNILSQLPSTPKLRRFRGWREPVVRWLDARLKTDREQRDRKHLRNLEEKNLRAQGVDPKQAKEQASHIAGALIDDAAAARAAPVRPTPAPVDPAVAAAEKRERIKRMLAEAKSGAGRPKKRLLPEFVVTPLTLALSGKVRFLVGCLLIAGCALWAKQNELVSSDKLKSVAQDVSKNLKSTDLQNIAQTVKTQTAKPLNLPIVGKYFDSWFPGIAGLMLVVLGVFRGWKMSLFALPAAAAIVLGPAFGLPRVVMLVVGLALGGVGFFFGRSGE